MTFQLRNPGKLDGALYRDLIGKPFRAGAVGPDAYGCVGLLMAVMRRMGKLVADYVETEACLRVVLGELGEWERVPIPVPGDGVLLRSNDPDWHVGVMVDPHNMIHAHPHVGVVIERIDGALYRRRIEGFYRCKK